MIAGWSTLYGDKVSGWWFDGCYHSFNLHDFADDDPPNFKTFADAARAGNPDAALAFNPGQVPWLPALSAHQDFTAGEIGMRAQFPSPNGRRFSNLNAQYHILSYLGPLWGCFLKEGGHNASCLPRFTDAELASVVKAYTSDGWAITLDTPIHDNGTIYAAFLAQLQALRRALKADDSDAEGLPPHLGTDDMASIRHDGLMMGSSPARAHSAHMISKSGIKIDDTLVLLDQLSAMYRTKHNTVRSSDRFDVRKQPCWYLECENCTKSEYSWSASDPYWGHFNYPHQLPEGGASEQCVPSQHELQTERAAYTYVHLSNQDASSNFTSCASACCADVRCDAWTFLDAALHSWRPGGASSCIEGRPCCLLKNGPTNSSIRANSSATSGVVWRTTALVPPAQGMRSAPPLGGIATGSLELRADGSFREWTIYNQNPAGGVKFSKQDSWFIGITVGNQSRALRTHPPPGVRGVDSIQFFGNHPTVKLVPNADDASPQVETAVFAVGTYTPHDLNTSSRPAILFVLDADNSKGTTAVNVSLLLHASPNLEENQHRPATSGLHSVAINATACLKSCHALSSCVAWSWHRTVEGGTFGCFLHYGVAPLNSFQDGAFSGVKGLWVSSEQPSSNGVNCLNLERRASIAADPSSGNLALCTAAADGHSVDFGTSNHLGSAFEANVGASPSVSGTDIFGAVRVTARLLARERKTLNLSFGWRLPDRNYLNFTVGNFYSHLFDTAADAATEMITRSSETLTAIVALHSAVLNSSLPTWMQDTLVNSLCVTHLHYMFVRVPLEQSLSRVCVCFCRVSTDTAFLAAADITFGARGEVPQMAPVEPHGGSGKHSTA